MDGQEDAGGRPDGFIVVAQVGPVGGADLDEPRPRLAQDVGDPEAAADLHELAAADDDLGGRGCPLTQPLR